MSTTERIYADHAATTPARPEVVEAMLPFFAEIGFNPSSVHAEGRHARAALDTLRETIARTLSARAKEIVITGGGSEADNLALFGVARAQASRGKHILSTRIEHHAILHSLDMLAEDGWSIDYIDVDGDGLVDVQAFRAALRDDTVLATIMLANNEIGTVQPIAELARIARERSVLFHTDAVQGPAYLDVDVKKLGVDLLSISAHKFYGPKGVGALYVRDGTPISPVLVGGSQEFAKRAGTENLAGIAGLAKALELAAAERPAAALRLAELRDRFERLVQDRLPDVHINGAGAARLPNVSNISFAAVEADALVLRLDLEGAAISTGSACAAGSLEPSHVIAALGLEPRWLQAAVRFSFGRSTDLAQIERLADLVYNIVTDLRRFSVPGTY
ncbi:MAG: cysteine desulfurase family protein [Candidatus Baltobacteraceae bacterium]